MRISDIIVKIYNNPDDTELFSQLYNLVRNSSMREWLFQSDYFLDLRPEAVEAFAAVFKKEDTTWSHNQANASPYREVDGPTKIYLSRIHFGILTCHGWDLPSRINTPEMIAKDNTHCIELPEALVVCEQCTMNYGHFQLSTMARIYDIYENNAFFLPTNIIVIDDMLRSFTKQLIEAHPFFRTLRFFHARNNPLQICNKTYMPINKRLDALSEADILCRMWHNVSVSSTLKIKRIWIERRTSSNGSNNRRIANTNNRDEWLQRYEFTMLYMEDIETEDKISLFRSAEYVVGVEGAALINICHMNIHSAVVELHHEKRCDVIFGAIAKCKKLKYKRLACKSIYNKLDEESLIKRGFGYHMFPLICDFDRLSVLLEL